MGTCWLIGRPADGAGVHGGRGAQDAGRDVDDQVDVDVDDPVGHQPIGADHRAPPRPTPRRRRRRRRFRRRRAPLLSGPLRPDPLLLDKTQ